MTESTTEHLARFAASVKYEDIPAPAREYCKDILLDTVACAFAGHLGEETDQIARFAKSLATSTESTVIGGNNLSSALGENWFAMLADWCLERIEGKPAPNERVFFNALGQAKTEPY